MDHTSLSNITQEEFERYLVTALIFLLVSDFTFVRNVEEAIQALPPSEGNSPAVTHSDPSTLLRAGPSPASPHAGEESAQPLSLPTPAQTFSEDAKRILQKTGDTISKPLNAISRIFNDALDGAENKLTYLPGPFAPFELGRENRTSTPPAVPHWSHPDQIRQHSNPASRSASPGLMQTPVGQGDTLQPIQTPYKPRVRRMPSPALYSSNSAPNSPGYTPEDTPSRTGPYTNQPLALGYSMPRADRQLYAPRVSALLGSEGPASAHVSRTPTPNLDLVGMQAEIDNATEHAVVAARETLLQIFPGVDPEVVGWVLEANEGDLGRSIEALLEMSNE